jgi:hypothetical protein
VITASPASLHFTGSELGRAVGETVTLTNQSPRPQRVQLLPLPPDGPFHHSDSSCTEPLSPHQSCRVHVSFRPAHWGAATATLRIALGDGLHSVYAVHLSGHALRHGDHGAG